MGRIGVGTRTLSGGEVIIASKGGAPRSSDPPPIPWDAINRVPTLNNIFASFVKKHQAAQCIVRQHRES